MLLLLHILYVILFFYIIYVIYLLECYICNIQYVRKSESPINIRLNSHKKDVKNPDAIQACKHFNRNDHDFNNYGKFSTIEQLRNIRTKSFVRILLCEKTFG